MPLTQDVAIVTPTEVGELTHEAGLANLDEDGSTITNSCKWATNVMIPKLKLRGIQPEKISNTDDLKLAACYLAASMAIGSLKDDESQKAAEKYEKKGLEALEEFQFESIDGGEDGNIAARALPRALHVDSARVFNRPTDTRRPCDPGQSVGYWQK